MPIAASFRLRGIEARRGCSIIAWGGRGTCKQKSSNRAFFQEKVACLDYTKDEKRPRKGVAKADPIIHHLQWQYRVRNARSVAHLNTLIYVLVNVRVLEKAKSINKQLLQIH